jgi:prevent-host-death family protein
LVWSGGVKVINIQAAKTHLSRIVDEVGSGEEIVLAKAGKPLVRLVPYAVPGQPRKSGLFAGQAWEAPDCWAPDDGGLDASIDGPLFSGVVEEPPAEPKP